MERLCRYSHCTPSERALDDSASRLQNRTGVISHFLAVARATSAGQGRFGRLRWSKLIPEKDGHNVRLEGKTGTLRVATSPNSPSDTLAHRRPHHRDEDGMFAASMGSHASVRLKKAQERQCIPAERQWTVHGVRRRWCMSLIESGVPIHVYADQAGHSPAVALEHYSRLSDRDRRAAAVRVDAHEDIHQWLGENGLSVSEAIEVLTAHLEAQRSQGGHLRVVSSEG